MNRHLPAGQGIQPDMGRGRRQYHNNQNHQNHQNQHYPTAPPMYNGYMQPYSSTFYAQQLPPQYHNTGMHPQYSPYQNYGRSPPPPMQQYVHAPVPQHPYPRPQQSPALAASYQPSPPQRPTSTQSSQTAPGPMTPPTPHAKSLSILSSSPPEEPRTTPFRAPLPWYSRPDHSWPHRRRRPKKRQTTPESIAESVELPASQPASEEQRQSTTAPPPNARPETPSTTRPTSEDAGSTNPTTPSSSQQTSIPAPGETTPVTPRASQRSRPVVPVVPAVHKPPSRDITGTGQRASETSQPTQSMPADAVQEILKSNGDVSEQSTAPAQKTPPPPVKAWTAPKSWTGLFSQSVNSTTSSSDARKSSPVASFGKNNAESLAEALHSFNAESKDAKVSFLEPRGLVNSGNMCYMNSVLQVLVFCAPFYGFLDLVSKRAAHSFKSETPLIDAMIMFVREFHVIDSAKSVEQLRMRLKDNELEQYGEPFTPDFVYDVMRRLPRFVTMQRGHQQDAEEFLGFLLEGLHEECVQVMRASASSRTSAVATPTNRASPTSEVANIADSMLGGGGWQQVGPKQKAAVTRSSGTITTGSPVTKIFGGNLRSELRVPGLKDSVTLEPYQPLQLDIGAPHVNNIMDALKGLTRSEALHGNFKSPKGPNVTATKQVFIESVPPVLILHLKRFQYNNAGGTQKVWKKVGYPFELELPKEVFPRAKRAIFAHDGLPKYRLIAAVYHHGKNASGGHYTVDVRRQDGSEWIRIDDTVIRRVKSEEVAEGGSEQDPKALAAAMGIPMEDGSTPANIYSSIGEEEGAEDKDEGWKQATGTGKKWSSVVNGSSTPKTKHEKFSVMDNKVAYLLFYQRI